MRTQKWDKNGKTGGEQNWNDPKVPKMDTKRKQNGKKAGTRSQNKNPKAGLE